MVKGLSFVFAGILWFYPSIAQFSWIQPCIRKPCYTYHFYWPVATPGERIFLHFAEVDRQLIVYVNGKVAGVHGGGFGPFSLDITDKVKQGDNEMIIPELCLPQREGMEEIWELAWIDAVSKTPAPRR